MSQLSFDLGGPEPLTPEDLEAPNLFYALRPPVDVGLEIMAEASEISRRERMRPPRPASVLHLTLCKIGHYGHVASVIETARRIGDGLAGRRFDVSLTRLMHFQGAGAVVLATDQIAQEIAALNGDLVRELRREGFKPPAGFKPHVTSSTRSGSSCQKRRCRVRSAGRPPSSNSSRARPARPGTRCWAVGP